ncbi:MAG: hypothetical protein AAF490_32660, partial [Chloroflexota bacterium]
ELLWVPTILIFLAVCFVVIYPPASIIFGFNQRNNRHQEVKRIADWLGWEFIPRYLPKKINRETTLYERNIIISETNRWALKISDRLIESRDPYKRNHAPHFKKQTVFSITSRNKKLPRFNIRSRTWLDGVVDSIFVGDDLATWSTDDKFFAMLTSSEIVNYYEKRLKHDSNLVINCEAQQITIEFEGLGYLRATKEQYLNLIAEGKYIIQLLNLYFDDAESDV